MKGFLKRAVEWLASLGNASSSPQSPEEVAEEADRLIQFQGYVSVPPLVD